MKQASLIAVSIPILGYAGWSWLAGTGVDQ